MGECPFYLDFSFEAGSEVIQVKRKYNIPTEIIGEIGGVLKVALMFGMVYTIYNKAKKKSLIIKSVFSSRKKNRKNRVRQRRHGQAPNQSQNAEGSGKPQRVKFLLSRKSQKIAPPQVSKKVKQECFKAKLDFPYLVKKLNSLDFLQKIGLNEWTKKMLPQALLIKGLIESSTILRERFEALKKKAEERRVQEKSSKNHDLLNRSNGTQEQRLALAEHSSKEDSKQNSVSDSRKKEDQIKNLLKMFIESKIHGQPKNGSFSQKNRAETWSTDLVKVAEARDIQGITKSNHHRNKGILKSCSSRRVVKNETLKENPKPEIDPQQHYQNIQNSTQKKINQASMPQSLRKRPDQAPTGLKGRKKFGSSASLGRRILFKSRLTGSKIRKKSSAKKL